MTHQNAEKISGHAVIRSDGHWLVYCACGPHQRAIRVPIGADESGELKTLVEDVYRHHCAIVRERQEYKCFLCGDLKPLDCHHKDGRGRGERSDRIDDIVGLCRHCHDEAHAHNLAV